MAPWSQVRKLEREGEELRAELENFRTTQADVASGAPETVVLSKVIRGAAAADSLLQLVHALLDDKRYGKAQALASSLRDDVLTEQLGSLLEGVIASRRRFDSLAVECFDRAGEDVALERCPKEYLVSLLKVDRTRGTALIRDLVQRSHPLPADVWWEAVRYTFAVSADVDNVALVDRLAAAYDADPERWPPGREKIPWLRTWLGRPRNRTLPAVPDRVQLGIMSYRQPDRSWSSRNIGDWIQTIAATGHVVRQQDLRYGGGDAALVEVVEELAGRVRPELQLHDVAADVDLHLVERDASGYQEFPEGTWMLAFGWFMHPEFNVEEFFGLPFHSALRPVFVSFHCNKRAMLTPEVLQYLRDNGPIGCRDWTTVDLLLSLDVPAFFSGCLTTTVNTVFPDMTDPAPTGGTAYVDVTRRPVPAGRENIPQQVGAVKGRTFERNIRDAVALLEDYRHSYRRVITTRLHCYLPATSLGLEVEFEPKNNADVRFNGLFRLDATEFEAIRTPMRDRLQPVVTAIVSGASEEEVRRVWAQTNAADLAFARERHARTDKVDAHANRWPARLASAAASPAEPSDVVDIVITPEQNKLGYLGPLIRSVAANSSSAVRVWVLGPQDPQVGIAGVDVRWVDTSSLARDNLSAVEIGKVAIADLIPVDRVVVLPVEAVVTGDIAELARIDLGRTSVAARSTAAASGSGFGVLYRAGMRLDAEPDQAFELYRDAHHRHRFDYDSFDPEVMVADLVRLRESSASTTLIGAMHCYGFNAREAWHYLLGHDRTVLDPSWAHVPTRDPEGEPRVWWWADGTKPWHPTRAPERERWLAYAKP